MNWYSVGDPEYIRSAAGIGVRTVRQHAHARNNQSGAGE